MISGYIGIIYIIRDAQSRRMWNPFGSEALSLTFGENVEHTWILIHDANCFNFKARIGRPNVRPPYDEEKQKL